MQLCVTQVKYISCSMGTCDLPDICALALGFCARAYISGKSLVPMLQLLLNEHGVKIGICGLHYTTLFISKDPY